MRLGIPASALLLACALPLLAGCSVPEMQVHNAAGFAQTPLGKTAVLKVTARPLGKPKSAAVLWGVMQVPHAQESFAELLAHCASKAGGLDVIPPTDVTAAIKRAGMKPTLDPTPEQLASFIEALGCASYLTAHVEAWGESYLLTSSKATIRFVVSCHVPGAEEPLWSVSVDRTRRGISHREAAISALRDAFEYIAKQAAAGPQQGS